MSVLVHLCCGLIVLACGSSALAADLIGKVTRNGRSQPNAQVSLQSKAKPSEPLTTRTDAAGNYAFSRLATGAYIVTCNDKPMEVDVLPGVTRADCKD
jgi:hypothetical protein